MHTRFILLNPSHAGNVGAVARAMKVMAFDDLVLVQPRWSDVLQRPEAIDRASGATDVLGKARVVQSWAEAVEGIEHVCATAMTPRNFGPPTVAPREHFSHLADAMHAPVPLRSVGLVFGSERYGMSNADTYRCHTCLRIPVNPEYGSLNLAAAAQVLAYEWRQAIGWSIAATTVPTVRRADAAQVQAMLTHLEQALVVLGYLDPTAPKKLMPRLQQLFNRADLLEEEIHILRGIAKAIEGSAKKDKP